MSDRGPGVNRTTAEAARADDEPTAGGSSPACACDAAPSISAHFDAKVRRMGSGATGTPHATTRALLDLLGDANGHTVLELGAGRGGLLLEVMRNGAARVTGIELSEASLAVARQRIADDGYADRADLVVGDGAAVPLEPHDWVVLDRVICCYPGADALVAHSAGAARQRYAFAVPDSGGWRGVASRIARLVDNSWNSLMRRPCTTFVHDLERIDGILRGAGLVPSATARRGLWHVAVYERASAGPGQTVPARPRS